MDSNYWYNVYQDDHWQRFPSREEADKQVVFTVTNEITTKFLTRYGCYPERLFLKLMKDREEILTLYEEHVQAQQLDDRIITSLWTAYSRFWWNNRETNRG